MNESTSVRFKLAAARGVLDAASVIALGTHLGAWLGLGLAFTLVGWACVAECVVSVLVAVLAMWLLIRVTIDRRLFIALEHAVVNVNVNVTVTATETDALDALDQALLQLGWIDRAKAARPLDARVRGVTGLLRQTVALAVVQLLAVATAAVSGAFV